MAFGFARQPDITILSGSSGGASVIRNFEDAYGLAIQAPATLTASQVSVYVGVSTATAPNILQSGGSDVVLAAGKTLVITPVPFLSLTLQSTAGGGEGADRTFSVSKVFLT